MSGIKKLMISAVAMGSGFLIFILMISSVVTAIFGGAGAIDEDGNISYEVLGQRLISQSTEQYREQIIAHCENHHISDYVPLVLAIIMVETGGENGGDVMGSTKHQDPRNTSAINMPTVSIMFGVSVLANKISLAGVTAPNDLNRIKLVLQAYNFGFTYGDSFILWAINQPAFIENGFSEELVNTYVSSIVATDQVDPFGDVTYPARVMQYYNYRNIDGQLALPVDKEFGTVVTWFGENIKSNTGEWIASKSIVYEADFGVPIYAIDEGVVEEVGYGTTSNGLNGYGRYYIINHGNRLFSLYANCVEEESLIKVGDTIRKGQHIANVGNSGAATKSILHFEIRLGGADAAPIDPKPFLYPTETT